MRYMKYPERTSDILHIRTLAVLREIGQCANRLYTRICTHTRARKEVDSLALTLRSTISYRGRRLDRHHYNHRYHHYEAPSSPRNTWRRLYHGERDAGQGGKRGRFFKSSYQGSILAECPRATHRKRSNATARICRPPIILLEIQLPVPT